MYWDDAEPVFCDQEVSAMQMPGSETGDDSA